MSAILNLHDIIPRSRTGGPGLRMCVWFQGCSRGCPGCFNPDTHSHQPRNLIPVEDLVQAILADSAVIEGITLSGGEPLEQAAGLLSLLQEVRSRTRLTVILFSGYTRSEIEATDTGRAVLRDVDALIAGPFEQDCAIARGILGSRNQSIHLPTSAYTMDEIVSTPESEVRIDSEGRITVSGILPPQLDDRDFARPVITPEIDPAAQEAL